MRTMSFPGFVRAVFFAMAAAACNPVYAPPVRTMHAGAPGRVRQGDGEVGGTRAGLTYPTAGSLHVAVGVRDWVSMEAGGTFIVAPAGPTEPSIVMGWAGTRFTLPRRRNGPSLLLDGELGVGAGVGGSLCIRNAQGADVCDADGRRWYDRGAFGGYEGGGIGFGYEWFSLYGRARVEESVATGIPVTYWPSLMLGLGFDLGPRVSLDLGGGYLGYFNEKDHTDGWFYQLGVSGRFGRAK